MTPAALQASKNFVQAADKLPTMWSLGDEFNALVDLLETPDADPAAIEQEMARVAGDIKHKASGVAVVIGALEGLAAFQKANADRLAAKAKANQSHADRLRDYALRCMQAIELQQLETGTHTLAVRLNNPSVNVLDASVIPSEYQRTKIDVSVDKVGILAAHKDGVVVPGVEIVRSVSLRIS